MASEKGIELPALSKLSINSEHAFTVPVKKIHEGQDVSHFVTSKAYGDIMTFLLQLNRAMFPVKDGRSDIQSSIVGRSNEQYSQTIRSLRELLNKLEQLIEETPPDAGPRRFGNVSFRKWYKKVEEAAPTLLNNHLSSCSVTAQPPSPSIHEELLPYFLGSFGSAQRLDYGSGHELSFLAFLACIWKLDGFLPENETSEQEQSRAIVLGVLADYFRLIRSLIKTYTLEPAGSHGVWGLDDHSFLPYVFGSAQYGPAVSSADQTPTEGSWAEAPDPSDVTKATAVERHRVQNLYFGAIGFIYDVKKGPFWEHSPMLFDISGVKAGWGKINKGMIKMYAAEVLGKFPVVQHFPFGSLLSWETDPLAPPPSASAHTSSQPASGSRIGVEHPPLPLSSTRGTQPETTKAPWANRGAGTGLRGAVTPAPWVTARPTGPGRRPDQDNGNSGTANPTMMPPTRAPWAKPP